MSAVARLMEALSTGRCGELASITSIDRDASLRAFIVTGVTAKGAAFMTEVHNDPVGRSELAAAAQKEMIDARRRPMNDGDRAVILAMGETLNALPGRVRIECEYDLSSNRTMLVGTVRAEWGVIKYLDGAVDANAIYEVGQKVSRDPNWQQMEHLSDWTIEKKAKK